MAFKESELYSNEKIVLDLHPHAIVLMRSIIALVISVLFGIWVVFGWQPEGTLAGVLKVVVAAAIGAALIYFIIQWIGMMTTQFVVTTDRCIFRHGVLAKSGVEIPLDRINTVFFHQTIAERMVGCGSLALESAGERGTETIEHVRNPVRVQHTLYEQIEENENRKFDRIGSNASSAGGGSSRPQGDDDSDRPEARQSVADEIAKLAVLLEQGHISQAEFDSHKEQLLSGNK